MEGRLLARARARQAEIRSQNKAAELRRREEISALSAGVGTPEDCAKKIQSRVSIWLAEHN